MSEKTSFLVLLAIVFSLSYVPKADAGDLTFGNILVANGDTVYEYTKTGTLVQSFLVPSPEVGDPVMIRDVVAESKTRFHVMTYGGTFMASEQLYLTTHDISSGTWEHNTIAGWSLPSNTSYGTMAMDRQYIYCPDGSTNGREAYGTIRFPLNDLANPERFHSSQGNDPQWRNYDVGLDGVLYANKRGGVFTYSIFDRATMAIVEERVTPEHPVNDTVNAVSFDRNGHFYAMCARSRYTFIHYDADGKIVDRVGGVGATDIDLGSDGTLVCGSDEGTIAITHRSKMGSLTIDDFTFVDTSDRDHEDIFAQNFVEIIEDHRCKGATHTGTSGNDNIVVDVTGKDFVGIAGLGGADKITIIGTAEEDLVLDICSGNGADDIDVRVNVAATIDLGNQSDKFTSNSTKPLIIYGGAGNDEFKGVRVNDTILGQLGSDTIFGKNGDDFIDGGVGNDKISGGNGSDVVLGGGGTDTLSGDGGNDIIDGGANGDTISGNNGSDILLGRGGNDTIRGHEGVDFLFGEFGDDNLHGGGSNGFMSGGNGSDELRASGNGLNSYFGGQGIDTLVWSTDQSANSRYVSDTRDVLIPRPLWLSDGRKMTVAKFKQLIQSAQDRLDDANVAHPKY